MTKSPDLPLDELERLPASAAKCLRNYSTKFDGIHRDIADDFEAGAVALEALPHLIALARSAERMREALHEIDIEAANTIPPDGKDAAFAALDRITRIINPFRARQALEGLKP